MVLFHSMKFPLLSIFGFATFISSFGWAQEDPAKEPSVVAVAKAMPAVVNINTERVVKRTVRDPYDDFFNNFFGGPMRPPRQIRQKVQSLGSGFIVDPKGYIVTNEHVVERAAELKISITTNDGKTYEAHYVTGSSESDLALLKIESAEPLAFIKLSDLSPNYLGQTVLVLGNPLGYGSSVARGILSAKNRTVAVDEIEHKGLIQTDAAINPGNSGGPVVDLAGKLVGVSSVKMAFTPQGVPTQGLGFAIPGEVVRTKVEEFKKAAASEKKGKRAAPMSLARKYFGLQLQDLTADLSETLGYEPGSGVLVADVDPKSPAEEAGITRGIVIYQVGRYAITSAKQVDELLETVGSGAPVDFTVGAIRKVRGQNFRQLQTVSLKAR
uniref:Peptidase S1/S6 chymotrypsin/Hap n=1 Tax=uncultured Verrucomicrobiota bacterium TaxID=156588 RepID=D2DXS8_9BACT|nr:peptidase S1/S6 chymotrypsin/Hap [uncultured Verrucomicrobiota bacterium]